LWWWYWVARLRVSETTTLWHVVLFLFGILAGVASAVTAGGVAVYTILAWALGVPSASDTAAHFAALVPAVAFIVVGTGAWLYHGAVLRERLAPEERTSDPARLYRYLLATAGLVAAAGAIASAAALVIDALIPVGELVRAGDWWRDQAAVTLTLAIVGGPLWWLSWSRAQAAVAGAGHEERAALPRRAFLFGVFAVAVIVTLANLAVLLFEIFDAALAGDVSREVMRDTRWPVALLLTAGAVAGYYWLVLREDQAAVAAFEQPETVQQMEPPPPAERRPRVPETPPVFGNRPRVTVVASESVADALVTRLVGDGYAVRVLRRVDDVGAPIDPAALDALMRQMSTLRAAEVLVTVDADGHVDGVPVTSDEFGI